MRLIITGALCASLALGACTTTQRVTPIQPGDTAMSCSQLTREFARLDAVMRDAERDQGVNVANVAAVLFFWPAAVGNYLTAGEARDLVDDRRAHLMEIYDRKGCR